MPLQLFERVFVSDHLKSEACDLVGSARTNCDRHCNDELDDGHYEEKGQLL